MELDDGDVENDGLVLHRKVRLKTQTHGAFSMTQYIFNQILHVKKEFVELISSQTEETVDLSFVKKILHDRKALEDNTFIGNISDGTSDIELVVIEKLAKSEAFPKINNINILHRNVNQCGEWAKTNGKPIDRPRYNDPQINTPSQPNAFYLGNVMQNLGETFTDMSNNLKGLSQVLKDDKDFRDPEKREEQRRTIQNNMDTVRYNAPLFKNLTKLGIPVNYPQGKIELNEDN